MRPLHLLLAILASAVGRADWSPQDFGARADGFTLDTAALQQAIDAAHAAGGGTVNLAAGRYLTGTIEMRGGVTLHLARDATLLGSARIADYRRGKWPALVLAIAQQNIAITGEGVIDGQGALVAADTVRIFDSGRLTDFFPGVADGQTVNLGADTTTGRVIDPHAMQRAGTLARLVAPRDRADRATWRVDESVRPQLIEFSHCRGVRVTGVTLQHAANWVQSYRYCEDVEIRAIRVESTTYWNNDGLDLVNCRRVRVADCDINAADDGICLKSEPNAAARGCEDIVIQRCRLRTSASAVKLGTASHHAFRRIVVEDLEVRDTYRSAVALETVDGGDLEDITVRRVRARHTGNAFFLRLGQRNLDRPPGALRRVILRDFDVEIPAAKPDAGYPHEGPSPTIATNLLPAVIVGLPDRAIEDLELQDIVITTAGGASRQRAEVPSDQLALVPEHRAGYPEYTMFGELPCWGLFVRHARNLRLRRVALRLAAPDFRPALIADRVAELRLDDVHLDTAGSAIALVLAGVRPAPALAGVRAPADIRRRVLVLPSPGDRP